jgi:hypothetical protein
MGDLRHTAQAPGTRVGHDWSESTVMTGMESSDSKHNLWNTVSSSLETQHIWETCQGM